MGTLKIVSTNKPEKQTAIVQAMQELELKKPFEFQMFLLWLSLPAVLRYPPKVKEERILEGGKKETVFVDQDVRTHALSMGVEDDVVLDLITLKTQGDFAARFKVAQDTLTDWKQEIYQRDLLGDITEWMKPLSRNVIMSLYKTVMKGGLPEHYALWFKIGHQWSDKLNIDIRQRVIKTVKVEVVTKKEQ